MLSSSPINGVDVPQPAPDVVPSPPPIPHSPSTPPEVIEPPLPVPRPPIRDPIVPDGVRTHRPGLPPT